MGGTWGFVPAAGRRWRCVESLRSEGPRAEEGREVHAGREGALYKHSLAQRLCRLSWIGCQLVGGCERDKGTY